MTRITTIMETITAPHRPIGYALEMYNTVRRTDSRRIDGVGLFHYLSSGEHPENAFTVTALVIAADIARGVTASVYRRLCDSEKAGYSALENALRRRRGCMRYFMRLVNSINYVDTNSTKAAEILDYTTFDGADLISAALSEVVKYSKYLPAINAFEFVDFLYTKGNKAVNSEIYSERKYTANVVSDDEKLYNVIIEFDDLVKSSNFDIAEFENRLEMVLTAAQLRTYHALFVSHSTYREHAKDEGVNINVITKRVKYIRSKAENIILELTA